MEGDAGAVAHAGDFEVLDAAAKAAHGGDEGVGMVSFGDGGVGVAMDDEVGDIGHVGDLGERGVLC